MFGIYYPVFFHFHFHVMFFISVRFHWNVVVGTGRSGQKAKRKTDRNGDSYVLSVLIGEAGKRKRGEGSGVCW